ncbi:prephenate dehydrogenase [Marvinbryantia formatexigens DSM 14469]|uniref:Prephenate dehydrogenase n=1 Tax=Marvinbryantia formatexigens DSM 14469 TaxID=478749 RepID=C6LGP4_9FIRM|nr:prephenate dehydrogenase [Marvinbryantia formatexigens]EET60244.1 prephenate dehydrogenase [Marvinbryantia formatexigens DSM 14469]UWO24267.1 prephenate dehydrogenase [Marvinbryantia formatexigens DSM 14469]SDF56865.1 prephenate dehydrogenase [Marvinbryantia formatexigens]
MNTDFTAGFVALGLIGGSIARAIKHFYPDATVLACARRRETLDYALKEHIIDEAYDDICEAFSRCDFIFLCAPVEVNIASLPKIKPFLKTDCILTDVGSTKTDIHERAAALGLSDWFIGGHPMAGSEKTGIEHSQWALIENAYYILTPSAGIAPEKVTRYTKLVSSLNALPLVLDCKEHDYVTAAISHLPHIIAATLVNLVHDEDTPNETMRTVAAGGFKDITRIASSSPDMWEQICTTNAGNIVSVLDAYTESLQKVRAQLLAKDSSAIHSLFERSRDYRNSFSDRSSGPLKKVYMLYCDMVDEAGGIATLATILASSGISLRNIGIVHNREFEEAVLRVEFYDEESLKKSVELLRRYRYTVYER